MDLFQDFLATHQAGRDKELLSKSFAVEPKVLFWWALWCAWCKGANWFKKMVKRASKELGITTILVTHDQEEAFGSCKRIVVINKGKIEQIGTPEDVFHNPKKWVCNKLLGNVNLFHAREIEDGANLEDITV